MARPMQRRKNRSSVPKKRQKQKSKKQILANPIIAAAWDSTITPEQNYKRIGLVSKLNKSTGGKERIAGELEDGTPFAPHDDALVINPKQRAAKPATEEVTIERDPETGAILRVVDNKKANPLNDPLNDLDSDEEEQIDFNALGKSLGRLSKKDPGASVSTDVTRQLDELAASGARSDPRGQSSREKEWCRELIEKHGDDYRAMFWDRKLNSMQQSEGDIKRRVKTYLKKEKTRI